LWLKEDHPVSYLGSKDPEGLNAWGGRGLTSAYVEHALVQRALNLIANEIAIDQRGVAMGAGVLRGVYAAVHMEQGHGLSLKLAAPRLARGQGIQLNDGKEGGGHEGRLLRRAGTKQMALSPRIEWILSPI
jgi:hypothetical protein